MSENGPPKLPDIVTNWALATGGKPAATGFVCAAAGIALISTTYAIPEAYLEWFRVPCLGLFLLGVGKIAWAMLFSKPV
ncbi:MAG: hypothetical protein J0H31_18975, partial [Alphaproteobacteria bacterium]|nr:hypothetical protein [Alphaproteobacteria bacterium]